MGIAIGVHCFCYLQIKTHITISVLHDAFTAGLCQIRKLAGWDRQRKTDTYPFQTPKAHVDARKLGPAECKVAIIVKVSSSRLDPCIVGVARVIEELLLF